MIISMSKRQGSMVVVVLQNHGCRCAAEPIHVQLNLATNYLEVVNTTSKELSDVAIESSVWDLEGACLCYEVLEKLTIPSKKTLSISEMKYPKSDNSKPVYFLLLKLYRREDYRLLSRNFYWLHQTGDSLLEPYKKSKVSLKITSMTYIRGFSYEITMHVENTSKKPDSRTLLHNIVLEKHRDGDSDMQSEGVRCVPERELERGLLQKVLQYISTNRSGMKVTEINGAGIGVAFFLHLSVHASNKDNKEGEDTRILPVQYSDNYFSLVLGELMMIALNFEFPPGVTPRITLHGWNYEGGHTVL